MLAVASICCACTVCSPPLLSRKQEEHLLKPYEVGRRCISPHTRTIREINGQLFFLLSITVMISYYVSLRDKKFVLRTNSTKKVQKLNYYLLRFTNPRPSFLGNKEIEKRFNELFSYLFGRWLSLVYGVPCYIFLLSA